MGTNWSPITTQDQDVLHIEKAHVDEKTLQKKASKRKQWYSVPRMIWIWVVLVHINLIEWKCTDLRLS